MKRIIMIIALLPIVAWGAANHASSYFTTVTMNIGQVGYPNIHLRCNQQPPSRGIGDSVSSIIPIANFYNDIWWSGDKNLTQNCTFHATDMNGVETKYLGIINFTMSQPVHDFQYNFDDVEKVIINYFKFEVPFCDDPWPHKQECIFFRPLIGGTVLAPETIHIVFNMPFELGKK